jgi:hypothetical protein
MVQGLPGQKIDKTLSHPITGCSGGCLSSEATQEGEIGRITVPSQPTQKCCKPHLSGIKLVMVVTTVMAGSLK